MQTALAACLELLSLKNEACRLSNHLLCNLAFLNTFLLTSFPKKGFTETSEAVSDGRFNKSMALVDGKTEEPAALLDL